MGQNMEEPRYSINKAAYQWLYSTEQMLKVFIAHKIPGSYCSLKVIAVQYVDTLMKHGLGFFDENVPLRLFGLLLDMGAMDEKRTVEFCTWALCYSRDPVTRSMCQQNALEYFGPPNTVMTEHASNESKMIYSLRRK